MIHRAGVFAVCFLFVTGSFWFGHRTGFARAQEQRVFSLGSVTRISPARNGEDVIQTWAAADPSNGRYLIACGWDQYPRQVIWTGYVYSSADAGTSWHQTILDKATKFTSEESCTYAADGRAYFAAGESDTSTGTPRHEWGHLNIFASGDHGVNWNEVWKRKDGWIDWTSMAAAPASHGSPPLLVVFGNGGTDKLGHWSTSSPVAIVSRDDGRSFTNLLAPRQPSGFNYASVWTSGFTVLPDGTALFATSAQLIRPKERYNEQYIGWLRNKHSRVEVFAYSPATGILSSRAVVHSRSMLKAAFFTVTMAQDTSHGRFGGRLYTAWHELNPNEDGTGTLWLGTSDDRGYHWSARPITAVGCVGDIKLAVAPNGTLGIIWSEDNARIDMVVSRDGGRTFGQSVVIAQHAPGAFAVDGAVPLNEYTAGEILAEAAGKSIWPYVDIDNNGNPRHLGVSIRLRQPAGIGDYAVVTDVNDAFHAIWAQVEPDGTHGLFTRTIRLGPEKSPVRSTLTSVSTRCPESGEQVHPPLPGVMPAVHPAGQRDVSRSFFLQIQNLNYDNATRVISADIVLKNKGKSVVRGPLSFFGIGLHSDYGTIAAANATGVLQSQPFWDASPVIPVTGLQPGASSKPLALRFKITNFQPQLVGLRNGQGGDASAMIVRIYQRSTKI